MKDHASWAVTFAFSLFAVALNAYLLKTLTYKQRLKAGKINSLLVLTGSEIALCLFLSCYLIIYQASGRPELESGFHTLHAIRNHWLMVITGCRLIVIAQPFRATQPGFFGARRQAQVLLGIVVAAVAVVWISAALTAPNNMPVRLVNESVVRLQPGQISANDTTRDDNVTIGGGGGGGGKSGQAFREAMRPVLIRYALIVSIGSIGPGVCIAGMGMRMAAALHGRAFNQASTMRSCKLVLLLSLGFIVCEFPFAVIHIITVVYVLSTSGPLSELEGVMNVLELVANWGMVFVPVDSCLNFFILTRYSRSFRSVLRKPVDVSAAQSRNVSTGELRLQLQQQRPLLRISQV